MSGRRLNFEKAARAELPRVWDPPGTQRPWMSLGLITDHAPLPLWKKQATACKATSRRYGRAPSLPKLKFLEDERDQ